MFKFFYSDQFDTCPNFIRLLLLLLETHIGEDYNKKEGEICFEE